ncbi:MAG: hypothetical protein ABJ013_15000 [Halioglobus sp.]
MTISQSRQSLLHLRTAGQRSEWLAMSGRQGQYSAQKPFNQCGPTDAWMLHIRDVLILRWKPLENTVWYEPLAEYTPARLRFWILHTLVPVILTQRRYCEFLHAGAIAYNGEAMIFTAASFGGKSTLTHYCLQQGFALVADDCVGLRTLGTKIEAVPGYPFCRPYRAAEELGTQVSDYAHSCLPVKAIYSLEKVAATATAQLLTLSGAARMQVLWENRFTAVSYLKAEQFKTTATLANELPVYRLLVPQSLDKLESVLDITLA